MSDKQPPTHSAYALRKESRHRSRYIEVGQAHIDRTPNGVHHVFLDRLPIGGFTGHLTIAPIGVTLPDPEAQPERPADDGDF